MFSEMAAVPLLVPVLIRIRAYELRATGITFDETAAGFLREAIPSGVINVIANEPNERDEQEYLAKWREGREVNRIPEDEPTVFLEVSVADASEFEADLEIRGEERFGYKVLTVSSTAVPNSIAAICLAMRDEFDWTEGSPLIHFLRFILWGSGEVAPVTPKILRRAESDRSRRPHVHAGRGPAGPGHPNYICVVTGLLCRARVVERATRQRFTVPDRRIPSCSVAVPSPPRRPSRSYCSP
jgi:hypothetical protein